MAGRLFLNGKTVQRTIGLHVKALASSLKVVVLQPSAKSGVHEIILFGSQQHRHPDQAAQILLQVNQVVWDALCVWEAQWAESKLAVVSRLTATEFAAMFLASRNGATSSTAPKSLIKVANSFQSDVIKNILKFYTEYRKRGP